MSLTDSSSKSGVKLIQSCNFNQAFWSLWDSSEQYKEIEFITFSELISDTFTSYNIITFYVTFILLFGRELRNFLENPFEKIIMNEMPYPDQLIKICEGIKLARYKNELVKEEELYYLLMDIFRSPEILKIMTKSSFKEIIDKQQNKID